MKTYDLKIPENIFKALQFRILLAFSEGIRGPIDRHVREVRSLLSQYGKPLVSSR